MITVINNYKNNYTQYITTNLFFVEETLIILCTLIFTGAFIIVICTV